MNSLSISVNSFYGDTKSYKSNIFDVECNEKTVIGDLPTSLSKILGPSNIWKIFRKQGELFDFLDSKAYNLNLMPFHFESLSDERLFLAAHPLVFWHYDELRKLDHRNSYEIIREHFPCKLYFDLEFSTKLNPSHNGEKMIITFLKIIFHLLKIKCSFENVLDLDSSTASKFSHHLIFQLPNHVFKDNYHVGYFVKTACEKILANINGHKEKIDLTKECNISQEELSELLVFDDKKKSVLFCDESVYSKNRHFRLYKSSKLNKKVPLLLSKNNKFCLKNTSANIDEQIFLASLITYFNEENLLHSCEILKFDQTNVSSSTALQHHSQYNSITSKSAVSLFPQLDKFIQHLIAPGKIWRVLYFDSNKKLVYDIFGNRYCHNIGREHKSNNIMIVVDTVNCVYYQKCHDYECKGFKSNEIKLPYEISFYVHNDNIDLVNSSEEDFKLLDDDIFSSQDCLQINEIAQIQPLKLNQTNCIENNVIEDLNCRTVIPKSSCAKESKSFTNQSSSPVEETCETEALVSLMSFSVNNQLRNKGSTGLADLSYLEEELDMEVCQLLDVLEDGSLIDENEFDLGAS